MLVIALAGCRKPRKRIYTKEQQRQIQTAILDAAPTPQIPINAVFDQKIRLIGIDLNKREVAAGTPFVVTWYWESLVDMSGGWKVFVHFEGPGKRSTHDHDPVGELYPIARWKAGEIIKDVQKISVNADFNIASAKLFAGIFDAAAWKDRQANVRMKVVNPGEVKTRVDRDGRIEVAEIKIKGGKAGAGRSKTDKRPRRYTALKPTEALVLDGKLNEPSWSAAAYMRPFVTPSGGRLRSEQLTRAKVLWDERYLYVGFSCPDKDIYNDQKGRDATLWKQDVVEVYLDPGADGKDYVELQVSPTGEVFDALFTSRRKPDWPTAAKALTMSGLVAKVHAEGTVNERGGDPDSSWQVEIAIPWTDVPGVSGPPKDGESWRMNLYRIELPRGKTPGFMGAWAPAGGDFHNVDAFGSVQFSKREAKARKPAPSKVRRAPGVVLPKRPGAAAPKGVQAQPGAKAKQPVQNVPTPGGAKAAPAVPVEPGKSGAPGAVLDLKRKASMATKAATAKVKAAGAAMPSAGVLKPAPGKLVMPKKLPTIVTTPKTVPVTK